MKRFSGIERADGFYGVERDIDGDFFWTRPRFSLKRQSPFGYLHMKICYLGAAGTLSIRSGSNGSGSGTGCALHSGWQELVVELPDAGSVGDKLNFQVAPAATVPPDSREFGICIRSIQGFDSPEEYRRRVRRLSNERDNEAEYQRGDTVLTTTPPKLRIDLESRCNMLPRCVYCAWDYTKVLETENTGWVPFTPDFFDELGEYYENAMEVVNCNHGETLLSPHFAAVVKRLDQDGKRFEFTTNGMLLNESVCSLLLGKEVYVYVSLDAATADSFAKYRNDQFDLIIGNIRRLCREKETHGGGFPKVFVSFILMRSNLAEIDAYLALCHELGVDAVKFRTLDEHDHTQGETQRRAGFEFNYAGERLNQEELKAAKTSILQANSKWGLTLFFQIDAEESCGPCDELWRSLYVLDRGIQPCCVGRGRIPNDTGIGVTSRKERIDRALNSRENQTLRAILAQGRFPDYCRELECPLIQECAK